MPIFVTSHLQLLVLTHGRATQLLTWRAPAPFAALLPLVPAFQQYPLSLGNGVINEYPTSQVVDKKCQFKMDMFHNIS